MSPEIGALLLQWLTAIGGVAGIAALLKVIVDWRAGRSVTEKVEAEATQIITDTTIKLLEPLKQQVADLTVELAASRLQVLMLGQYVDALVSSLRAANVPVPPHPGVPQVPGGGT